MRESTNGKRLIRPERVGDVRSRGLMPVLAGLSLVVAAWVLTLTSYRTFYFDEWDFVTQARSWDLNSLMRAHNEHWSTIPILVWKLLFLIVGLRSHVPYEGALLTAHIAAVLLLFLLIRRRSGDLPAFAAALTLLVLGGGGLDIVWAFQIGYVASIAFGLLAMILLESDLHFFSRLITASLALAGSLMSSGVGLAFLAAIAVDLAINPRGRRFLPGLVVPILMFGAWFIAYGAGLPGTPGAPCPSCLPVGFAADIHKGPIGISFVTTLAAFVGQGLASSAAAIFGSLDAAPAILAIVAVGIALHWFRQRTVESWQVGLVVGAVAWFVLVGLGRARNGPSAANDSHYLYVGAVFLLPLIADAAKELPWRKLWRQALTAVFAVILIANVLLLKAFALNQTDLMQVERAELQIVEVFHGAPDMALDRGLDPTIMPQLRAGPYLAAIAELGSPVPATKIEALSQMPPGIVDQEMLTLFGASMTVASKDARSIQGLVCQDIVSPSGLTVDLKVPAARAVALQTSGGGKVLIFLTYVGTPSSRAQQTLELQPMSPVWISMPDTGRATTWKLRIETTAVGVVQLCGPAAIQTTSTNNKYGASAYTGDLGPEWSMVSDGGAVSGRAAKLVSGTRVASFTNDAFGPWVVPNPGLYDVWYRVRVGSSAGTRPEMTLGLWDGTAGTWAIKTTLAAQQVRTNYSWIRVGTGILLDASHNVRYQASFISNFGPMLSTDWYVDQAELEPIGSPAPQT